MMSTEFERAVAERQSREADGESAAYATTLALAKDKQGVTVGSVLSKIAWVFTLGAAIIAAAQAADGFAAATSAPQQGAIAAMSCLYVIVPYVFARAIDELRR